MSDFETWEPPGGWDNLNLDPKGKFVSPAIYRYAAWARKENERLRGLVKKTEGYRQNLFDEVERLRAALDWALGTVYYHGPAGEAAEWDRELDEAHAALADQPAEGTNEPLSYREYLKGLTFP